MRVVGIVVLALLAVLLFGSALSVVRAAIALAGYVIVAVGAYHVGKWVGRKHHATE
jgi:4-amino-4-deoxy-L-arabinose transferase-like glycosyltransferase